MSRLSEHIERGKVIGASTLGSGNTLREIHHGLMSKYGWIPFEEFKELPLPTLHGLLIECMKEAEAMNEAMDSSKAGNNKLSTRGCSLPSRPR